MKDSIITVKPADILKMAVKELANGGSEWNHSMEFGNFVDRLVEGRLFRPDFTGEEDHTVWYQEIVADLLYRNWFNNCVGWAYYGIRPEVARKCFRVPGVLPSLVNGLVGKYANLCERVLR